MLLNRKDNRLNKSELQSQFHSIYQFLEAQLALIKFKRELLIKFQTEGTYSEDALNKVERELDIEELRINTLLQRTEVSAKITGQKE